MTKDKLWWADYRARNRVAIRTRHQTYMKTWRAKRKVQDTKDLQTARNFYYSK